jgi:hypothetical protein
MYRDHVSLRHVLGENVFFFAKTKIHPKNCIYCLEAKADHNPGPKVALTHKSNPSLPHIAVFSIPKLKMSGGIGKEGRSYSQSYHHIMSLQCLYVLRDSGD